MVRGLCPGGSVHLGGRRTPRARRRDPRARVTRAPSVFLTAYGAREADLALGELRAVHDLGPNGIVAWWGQRARGIEVYPSEVRLLMRPDLSLVAVAGRWPTVAGAIPPFSPALTTPEAFAVTVTDVLDVPIDPAEVVVLERVQEDFLVDRGGCNFVDKTANAEGAGAAGVVIANDRGGNPPFTSRTPGTALTIARCRSPRPQEVP